MLEQQSMYCTHRILYTQDFDLFLIKKQTNKQKNGIDVEEMTVIR